MSKKVKVKFPLETENEGYEVMFATCSVDGRFILDNSPFYIYGVSNRDEFTIINLDGALIFDKVVARSGHSTYRIKLPSEKTHEYFLKHWQVLEELGCTYESSSVNRYLLYSVDMPPTVDVAVAYQIMENLENEGVWEFEEAFYFDKKKHGPKN